MSHFILWRALSITASEQEDEGIQRGKGSEAEEKDGNIEA